MLKKMFVILYQYEPMLEFKMYEDDIFHAPVIFLESLIPLISFYWLFQGGASDLAPMLFVFISVYEPQHGKTNKVDSDQVWHKPDCTATRDG